MKKLICIFLMLMLLVTALASCGPDNGSEEVGNGKDFDQNRVSFTSAYSEAQKLGFEGTLDEFIAMISGTDGKDGKDGVDGVTPTVEISNDGYWVINGVKTNVKADATVNHNFGEWINYSGDSGVPCANKLFYRICADCSIVDWMSKSDASHSLDEYGICIYCNEIIAATDGVVYEVSDDGTYARVVGYSGTATRVRIADEYESLPVKEIHDQAFWNNKQITEIVIPDSVTSIGSSAFEYCSDLTSIVIPDSVTSIGSSAFGGCSKLTSIVIPDSVTSIGAGAFSSCYSLVSIIVGDGNTAYKSIDGNLYTKDGTTLIQYAIGKTDTSFTILNNVTSISSSAFSGCSGLTSVVIPDSVTSIGEYAFFNCSSLTSVVIGDSVTSIDDYAFRDCTSLTSIVIPDSVTSIGNSAFYNCTGLTSVHISDIAAWCEIEFSNYSANPLYYAKNLYLNGELVTELVIPEGVEKISDSAFRHYDNLMSIVIPDSVTSIGNYAFSNCDSLTSIIVGDGNTAYKSIDGNLYTKDGRTLIQYAKGKTDASFTIPDSVTNIGVSAFEYCSDLTSIVIPDSVTSIGNYAFYSCDSLTSVVIGNSVTNIGDAAFYDCSSLTSVVIPDGVTSIGGWAFAYCNSLTSVVIPDSVTSIGDYALYSCDSLTSVVIGDSVTSIGDSAFAWCYSLTSITVDEENTDYKSIDGNLYTKDGTTLIQYAIGKTNFRFTIPDSVTSIGSYAFQSCYSLTNVVIGNGVTNIGSYAFQSCHGLTSIVISDSVTSIGYMAFAYCSSLTSVAIPNSVTSIGNDAFYSCSKLTIYCEAESQAEGWNSDWNPSNRPVVWGHEE